MRLLSVTIFAFLSAAIAAPAGAASLTLDELTTPLTRTVRVTSAPGPVPEGSFVATGLKMNDGVSSFIAWCFDLTHQIAKGGPYTYTATDTPFSNSFLTAGAKDRAERLFNANYGSVDAYDAVQASAFQLALWEVAYDSDFDLTSGQFQGTGRGSFAAQIASTAAGYLQAASGFSGRGGWKVTFLENQNERTRQNLVTASPVPLPAALALLGGGLAALGAVRRRAVLKQRENA